MGQAVDHQDSHTGLEGSHTDLEVDKYLEVDMHPCHKDHVHWEAEALCQHLEVDNLCQPLDMDSLPVAGLCQLLDMDNLLVVVPCQLLGVGSPCQPLADQGVHLCGPLEEDHHSCLHGHFALTHQQPSGSDFVFRDYG